MPKIKGWEKAKALPKLAVEGWINTNREIEYAVWIYNIEDEYMVNCTSPKITKAMGKFKNMKMAQKTAIKYMREHENG